MAIFNCEMCGKEWKHEADTLPRRGNLCFSCHVRTISIGFTYGKADFHGPTVVERQRKQMEEASAAGVNAEPVGNRWV